MLYMVISLILSSPLFFYHLPFLNAFLSLPASIHPSFHLCSPRNNYNEEHAIPYIFDSLKMGGYEGWTIDQHERITPFTVHNHHYGRIIQGMQQTGYHKWGFTVYRCTYSDDKAWDRYMEFIKDQTITTLDFFGQQFLLEKYLDIQVIEDPQLDGASKTHVRSLFAERAERDRQVENGGPGMATSFCRRIPRFNYCVYVDQACLETLLAREEWDRERQLGGQERGMPPDVICAVIEAGCGPEGKGKDGYEPVEGCTRHYPGWMYCNIEFLVGLYDRLHFLEMTGDYELYERPPGVAQTNGMRMPL